jgi:hypothetical protein
MKHYLLAPLFALSLTACQSPQPMQFMPQQMVSQNALRSQNAQNTIQVPSNQRFVDEVAAAFHEAWRSARRKPDGSFEPRLKDTKDAVWIQAHGSQQVDIANTRYQDLPADWQVENKASADISVKLVLAAQGASLTPQFIEQGSHVIHIKWLERNQWAKGGELDKPYGALPEPEKQKDREALYQAINKGIELKLIKPTQVSQPVGQAISQMLAKIK